MEYAIIKKPKTVAFVLAFALSLCQMGYPRVDFSPPEELPADLCSVPDTEKAISSECRRQCVDEVTKCDLISSKDKFRCEALQSRCISTIASGDFWKWWRFEECEQKFTGCNNFVKAEIDHCRKTSGSNLISCIVQKS